jgi:hypothetical protein
MDKAELTFVLPDNQGAFSGKFEAKASWVVGFGREHR